MNKEYDELQEALKYLRAVERSVFEVKTKVDYLIKLSKQALVEQNPDLVKRNIVQLGVSKNMQEIEKML